MSRITVIDNPFVTMWYHSDTKIVHHQIHKFIHGKELREMLTTGTSLLAQHGASKWLSDDRESTVLSQEDFEWGRANWLGRSIAVGWKHWALVRPLKALGKMGMEQGAKDFGSFGLNVRFFDLPEPAMAWLKAQ